MARSLTSRKQDFVRDAIYDAAIELFVKKGFLQIGDVDDVAQAAGVSRRSFFRYFTTKDHVLAHSIMKYGDVLVSAIAASPAESSAFEVVQDVDIAGIRFATSDARTRQIMQITAQNFIAGETGASGPEWLKSRSGCVRPMPQEQEMKPKMMSGQGCWRCSRLCSLT